MAKKESTELQGEMPQNKQRIGDYFLLSLLGRGGFSEVYLELAIITQGKHLSFFINGLFITQIADSQYTQGSISLALFGRKGTNATAYFKNLSVWTL